MKQLEFESKAEKKNKTFYLSLEVINALQELADAAGVSQNLYIDALLKREAETVKLKPKTKTRGGKRRG